MFLSSSSKAIDAELDITDAVIGSGADSGVPNAEMLIAFTESANRLDEDLPNIREALVKEIGENGMVDTAITVSIFRSLNIAADSSGIRVDDDWVDTAAEFANQSYANEFSTAKNSPAVKTL
jgi:hypothetical protein